MTETESKPPSSPECKKLYAVHEQSQKIGEFLEWLQSEKGIVFGLYHTHDDSCYDDPEDDERSCGMSENVLYSKHLDINRVLAQFFNIDLDKVNEERVALLDYLHDKNRNV